MKKAILVSVISIALAAGITGCDRKTAGIVGGAAVGGTVGGMAGGTTGAVIGGVAGAALGHVITKDQHHKSHKKHTAASNT